MKKLSSYQKLKQENLMLRADIFNLVKNSEEQEGIVTLLRYETLYDIENINEVGKANNSLKFKGFVNDIKQIK